MGNQPYKTGQAKRQKRELSEQTHKQRVLSSGIAAVGVSIADAVVIKNGNVIFLCLPETTVPFEKPHGFGLYFNDCRYLDGYQLCLADTSLNVVGASDELGYMSVTRLTNPEIKISEDGYLPGQDVGVKIVRVVNQENHMLHEEITLHNYGVEEFEFPLSLSFRASFEDIYVVRGLEPESEGTLRSPRWKEGILHFQYEGADRVERRLEIHFSESVDRYEETTAYFDIKLEPREQRTIELTYMLEEGARSESAGRIRGDRKDLHEIEEVYRRSEEEWVQGCTTIESDSILYNRLLYRAFRDLYMLRSKIGNESYFAAGLPWFGTLYGRDSVITALQVLAYKPAVAEETLRVLARYQAKESNAWRDERPGKILHELRGGEMARLDEIPHTPYFGTVDATPLFLVLIGRHAAWTGKLSLFHELQESIDRALEWIDRHGDLDDDGYIEYAPWEETWLINQGWKDSGDALVNSDGTHAEPPIALVEAQAYVYMAKQELAWLYEKAGDASRAKQLREQAKALKERFDRDFWIDDIGFYALALQKDNKPAAVVSSNPGHALWSGIVDPGRAERIVSRLMADDMYSGWGIRTLSSKEHRYNPLGYHLGMVWPFENAMIASGFRRYGFDDAANRIFEGIADAAMHFHGNRLPEVFGGFSKDEYHIPVRYPVACHPQAWSAGSIPHLFVTSLGLVPDAFENLLHVIRPRLPESLNEVEVRGLRVGDKTVDLRFERRTDGRADVKILDKDGGLDVSVETGKNEGHESVIGQFLP